jgi:hypothetical protein
VVWVGHCGPDGSTSDHCRGAHAWAIIISAASRYGTAAIRYAATNRYGAAAHCASREGFSCNTREA